MDADTLTLSELFAKDVRYLVPPFQRPYVWNQDDQWAPLWVDVSETVERYLEQLTEAEDDEVVATENTRAHFLGAVVLQQEPSRTAEPEKREVIDGQQRLTTLQLLLNAAQRALERHGYAGHSKRLSKLVLNDEEFFDGNEDFKFKVWPITANRDAFRDAMTAGSSGEDSSASPIVQAHDYFLEQIADWLDRSAPREGTADALETTLTKLLQVVVIDLKRNDDPHMIFETLNARGTPLLAFDLTKNYLLQEASDQTASVQHDLEFFGGDWWREDVRQGRILRPRVDVF